MYGRQVLGANCGCTTPYSRDERGVMDTRRSSRLLNAGLEVGARNHDEKEEIEEKDDVLFDDNDPRNSPLNEKRGRLQRGDCLTNSSSYLNSRNLRERRGDISYVEPKESDFGKHHSSLYQDGHKSDSDSTDDHDDDEEDDDEEDEHGDEGSQPLRRSKRSSNRLSSKQDVSGNRKSSAGGSSGRRRATRMRSRSDAGSDSEKSLNGNYWRTSGNNNSRRDEHDDEDDEDENYGHKYTLRNRARTQRQTMNISTMGGVGGGYETSKASKVRRRELEDRINYRDSQRLYLGGKLPRHSTGSYRDKKHDNRDHYRSSSRRHRRFSRNNRRRHYDSSSESDSGRSRNSFSSTDEDRRFRRHEDRRIDRELDSIQPMNAAASLNSNGGSIRDKASRRDLSRADVNPIVVDSNISFDSVGGLDKHILALKEMVILPLLYPDVFQRFDTQPPRGTLFIGPPGTGKTLTARALANSLTTSSSQGGSKVSFFMRKGADCLSKWVGEGERQLRLLFEQAKKYQPSIIFFDEIDGLAPVRSVKQDQIHASIVSTLLALMDGLDSRGQVVVIGATNRPDAIDPALRRPGRFDRELLFPLPNANARSTILDINTKSWSPSLSSDIKDWVVKNSAGFCGADLKALCAEATLVALRRTFPQVYQSHERLTLDSSKISITRGDFAAALGKVVPSSRRSLSCSSKPLDATRKYLLGTSLERVITKIKIVFPVSDESVISYDKDLWISSLTDTAERNISSIFTSEERSMLTDGKFLSSSSSSSSPPSPSTMEKDIICSTALWNINSVTCSPRIMIGGARGMGQQEIGDAALHFLESFQVFQLDYNSLISDSAACSAENAIVSRVEEALKSAPSVLYLPNILIWWKSASEGMKIALLGAVQSFPSTSSVLWVSTISHEDSTSASCMKTPSKQGMNLDDTVLTDHQHGSPMSAGDNGINTSLNDERLRDLLHYLADVNVERISKSEDILQELCREGSGYIELAAPSVDERHALFESYFSTLPLIPSKIYMAHKKLHEAKHHNISTVEDENFIENRRQLRSSLNNDTAVSAAPPKYEKDERDIYHIRELRVFFRATLHELSKDKRYTVFWRQVDPYTVPDYYDIVKAPMDLDTIRMKVDDHFYETKEAFMHDIEQIAFNAKLYNPLSGKDYRTRNIVHVANSLLDVIETHAYNFKKELGSDVFKRCVEIARRTQYLEPKFTDRKVMHPENIKYYAEVMEVHRQRKVEMILEGKVDEKEDAEIEMDRETAEKLAQAMKEANVWKCDKCRVFNESKVRSCIVCNTRKSIDSIVGTRSETRSGRDARIDLFDFPDPEPPKKRRITSNAAATTAIRCTQDDQNQQAGSQNDAEKVDQMNRDNEGLDTYAEYNTDDANGKIGDANNIENTPEKQNVANNNGNSNDDDDDDDDDGKNNMNADTITKNTTAQLVDSSTTTMVSSSAIVKETESDTSVTVDDFDSIPFIASLKKSVWLSLQHDSIQTLSNLQMEIETLTKDWNCQSIFALMTQLNRALRNFQTHADWDQLIQNISTHLTDANNNGNHHVS